MNQIVLSICLDTYEKLTFAEKKKKLEKRCHELLKAGSHVRRKRKRKHKEVHTSNANASTVQYASAMEYSKMVDEVDVLVLLFFLFLGLRRIRCRRLIQRNNKSRPKRLRVREIFRKRQPFPFLSQHLPF